MPARQNARIGLLPFYLELYDRTSSSERRRPLEAFCASISGAFRRLGIDVVEAKICRLKSEFAAAVRMFENKEVDAIVSLHLAYSPSLESADVLARTRLPLIVLDTTPDYDFSPQQSSDKIMFNHGIHGVQDMCNMLLRNGKTFKIEAGHWKQSDVISRAASLARAAKAASLMRKSRVGLIGSPFKGMGDFQVPSDVLHRTVGVTTKRCVLQTMKKHLARVGDAEIAAEMASNRELFAMRDLDAAVLRCSVSAGLAVRRWIEAERLTGFSMNFLSVTKASGLPTVPFLEASLAMARGTGYAGEGDVLTAALVGALLGPYPNTTFTEMFCPDWKGNRIFLSHMGEINIRLIDGKPGLHAPAFRFADVTTPVKPFGCLGAGEAVLVNLAPMLSPKRGPRHTVKQYNLVIVPGDMIAAKRSARMKDNIRGWFSPRMKLVDFLAGYSMLGGTHHSALVYGDYAHELAAFGEFMGWHSVILG